jgi:TRAP-type C4-dicarboxylate transport system substrate-binding protein
MFLKSFRLISILMFLSATSYAETFTLRLGSGHPVGALEYTKTAAEWFAPELKKRIESKTKHKVNIQELHAGQVAKVTEVLEATRDGLLDIGFVSLIFEPSNSFHNNFTLMVPFSSPDSKITTKAAMETYKKHPELTNYFETKFNQKWLGSACLTNYGMGTKFAWNNFADLKGRKIAGAGINLGWLAQDKGGATPVASNLNEAYQSIQSGVYEGYLSTSRWWSTFKLNEVGGYYTKTDFGAQLFNVVTINLNTFKKLPKDVQQILINLGSEWAGVTAEVCEQFDKDGINVLKTKGVVVKEISKEAKVEWANALKDMPNQMAQDLNKKGFNGSGIIKTYIAELEKLGHKFPINYKIN